MNRRHFLGSVVASIASPAVAQVVDRNEPATQDQGLTWHDVRDWGIEGRAFHDTERFFDRLPARAKGLVRPEVWNLSRHTAGMAAFFETDAPAIHVRYRVLNRELAMAHMPATGVSGVDLYGRHEERWHWLGTHRPRGQSTDGVLAEAIRPGRRRYQLNLPLYNGVENLEIGVPKGAAFEGLAPRRERPILFYGTSITQGGCASRPGMAFVNLLGRRLERPILNFGFSGNGRMEPEVGRFLAELDPAVYVIDCVANMTAGQIAERTGPLVKQFRAEHARTPILLLEDRTWADAALRPGRMQVHAQERRALREAFERLRDEGVEHLHYRDATGLIGDDGEGTVDGSHPNDLGMMRYADALEPGIAKLL